MPETGSAGPLSHVANRTGRLSTLLDLDDALSRKLHIPSVAEQLDAETFRRKPAQEKGCLRHCPSEWTREGTNPHTAASRTRSGRVAPAMLFSHLRWTGRQDVREVAEGTTGDIAHSEGHIDKGKRLARPG